MNTVVRLGEHAWQHSHTNWFAERLSLEAFNSSSFLSVSNDFTFCLLFEMFSLSTEQFLSLQKVPEMLNNRKFQNLPLLQANLMLAKQQPHFVAFPYLQAAPMVREIWILNRQLTLVHYYVFCTSSWAFQVAAALSPVVLVCVSTTLPAAATDRSFDHVALTRL